MLDTIQQQKTLPHSEESERAVLAGVLLDPQQLPVISGRLIPDDFYFERHRKVYQSMIDLQSAETEIDLRTLQARLQQQNQLDAVGGLAYLAGLDLDLPDLGRLDSYVEIVKERSVRRRLIDACGEITRNCLDGGLEAAEALGRAEQSILELGELAIRRGFVPLNEVFDVTMEELGWFTLFGTCNIAVPVNSAIKRRVTGQHDEFLHLYMVPSSAAALPSFAHLLNYPGVAL